MREVVVIGVGMTPFGKFLDRSLKSLAAEAVQAAANDAGIGLRDLQAAFVGSAVAGLMTGQECIRGQVVLRAMGLGGIPVTNVENACATASTAFHGAWIAVAAGLYDVVLALGMEKLYHEDRQRSFAALAGAIDVEAEAASPGEAGQPQRSLFMDHYAGKAREHMRQYGTTREQIARVAVKNHTNARLNPYAQYRTPRTLEEVLSARIIADPLTLPMCSPLGDGAAAVILASGDFARRRGRATIRVAASVLRSGEDHGADEPGLVERAARAAYEMAGLGARDLDLVEVHDAAASAELIIYEDLGLCPKGDGGPFVDSGQTALGGKVPVNPGGGLLARGHPVGATGLAQIAEVVWQLRGEAGDRQVARARVGMTQNAGGVLRGEEAASCIHILAR